MIVTTGDLGADRSDPTQIAPGSGERVDWSVVHPATIVTAFATVFVAELPDKTMLATVVLSARFKRPLAVWIGAASALTVQMAIAVVAGRLLGLLPDRAVSAAVAVLFGAGAVRAVAVRRRGR